MLDLCYSATYFDLLVGLALTVRGSGAFAIYLEPWHADVFEFLDLRKNTGTEENRARDLFYALWIPDLFMKRVEQVGIPSIPSCLGVSVVGQSLRDQAASIGKSARCVPWQSLQRVLCTRLRLSDEALPAHRTGCGRCSAPLKPPASRMFTVRNSRRCTRSMSRRAALARPSRRRSAQRR